MIVALYPGTFDPVTYGHLDVIRRAAALFGKVIVGVSVNPRKATRFSPDERVEMLRDACQALDNVSVERAPGLVVDYARSAGANVIVRGLRAVADFEYELQMASMNRTMAPEIETIFFTPAPEYHYLSSSMVVEIACFGGDVSAFVPPEVARRLREWTGPSGPRGSSQGPTGSPARGEGKEGSP